MRTFCRRFFPALWVLFVTVQLTKGQDAERPAAEDLRQWTVLTEAGERTVQARLLALRQGHVLLQGASGATHSLPLAKLAADDRQAALIERVGSGVVVIHTKDVFDQDAGFGSGFVVHENGLILTNYHVLAGAASVAITFRDAADSFAAEVLGVDHRHDIACLRVEQLPPDVHVLELAAKQSTVPGTSVWTVGHPAGLKNTVGWGHVNAVRNAGEFPEDLQQQLDAPEESRWLQTNAVLGAGSSGGPALNELGQVIGINTFIAGPQLGFAIHVAHARQAYAEATRGAAKALPLPPDEQEDPLAWFSREVAPSIRGLSEETEALTPLAKKLPRQELIAQYQAIHKKYRDQLLQIAREQTDRWPAVQALSYAANLSDPDDAAEVLEEIGDLALKHHSANYHVTAIVRAMSQHQHNAAREFCRRVIQASPHDEVRLLTTLALAANLLQWLQTPDTIALDAIRRHRSELDSLMDQLDESCQDENSALYGDGGKSLVNALRQQAASLTLGLETPEIEGVDIEGDTFKLSEYRGKVVLLDFFVNWCPHCRRMYPSERQMVEKYREQPFVLLGVNCESQQVLDRLINEGTVTWRTWADGNGGPIAQQWNVSGFPTLVLIDHNGILRWRSSGVPEIAELTKMVEQLMAEVTEGVDAMP